MKDCPKCLAPMVEKNNCLVCGWSKSSEPKKEKKPRISPEEKALREAEKAAAKEAKEKEREEKRQAKETARLEKAQKAQRTEADLVRQYAKVIIGKQQTRGMINKNFSELKKEGTVNKNLWQDQDFFFSVVFQSRAQKYAFLEFLYEKFGVEETVNDDGSGLVQIVNGMRLAEMMGCQLRKEVAADFPTGNIELREFVLDTETLSD